MISRTFLFFLAYTIPALAGFALLAVLTRALPVAEYAAYSLANSVAILVASVAFGWLKFGIARYQPGRSSKSLTRTFIVGGPAASAAIVVVAAATVWAIGLSYVWIVAISALSISYGLFESMQEQNKALGFNQRFIAFNVGRSAVGFVFGVGAALLWREGFASIIAGAIGFALMSILLALRPIDAGTDGSGEALPVGSFLRYGFTFSISGAINMMRPAAVKAVAVAGLSAYGAGGFAAAYDISGQIVGALAIAVYSAVAPGTFRNNRQLHNEQMTRDLSRAAEFYFILTAPAVVGMAFVSSEFTDLFAGPSFHDEVSKLLAWVTLSAALTNFIGFYLHLSFQIAEKPGLQILTTAIAIGVTIAGAWLLTPVYGTSGLVAGLIIGDVTGIVVALVLRSYAWPLPLPLVGMARILAATAVMALVLWMLQPALHGGPLALLFIKVIAGAMAFVLGSIVFDVARVRSHEWPRLRERLRTQIS